ncbi:MAG: TrkH family potassium uptake protein [Gammaproteobacteria bacterium]|jgi:trk system potassium uptake protein TrkH
MQFAAIQRIIGVLLMLFSSTLLVPIGISLFTGDGALDAFIWALSLLLLAGLLLWFPVRKRHQELRVREGFIVAFVIWITVCISGAVPFILAAHPHMSFTDAVFESTSALTTTGSTVLVGLDHLPASILYYRQQLQLLGGMGIIVLAVAILPMLGVGGMQLYRAEVPGPMKDAKLTPRITETAKALWYIYVGLVVLCAFSYWLAGMTPWDAILHSYGTLSTGGFSSHDASFAYFNSKSISLVGSLFMFLGGVNFSLHFLAWRHTSIKQYFLDPEFRTYLGIMVAIIIICVAMLLVEHVYSDPVLAVVDSIFQTVSIMSCTGFTSAVFQKWPTFIPLLLIFSSFIGGCAGSTSGGLKVIRVLLLFKQGMREIKLLVHPSAVIPVKIGHHVLPDRVVGAIWGFFAMYVVVFTALLLGLMATGVDQVTAFSGLAACINNMGPGLGRVSANFASINPAAKWIYSLSMILGRLEIFTLVVLLTPAFWRK